MLFVETALKLIAHGGISTNGEWGVLDCGEATQMMKTTMWPLSFNISRGSYPEHAIGGINCSSDIV